MSIDWSKMDEKSELPSFTTDKSPTTPKEKETSVNSNPKKTSEKLIESTLKKEQNANSTQKKVPEKIGKPAEATLQKEKEDFRKTLDKEISKLNKPSQSSTTSSPQRGYRGRRGGRGNRGHSNKPAKEQAPSPGWSSRTFSDKQTSPIWETKVASLKESSPVKNSLVIPTANIDKNGKLVLNSASISSSFNKEDVTKEIACKDMGTLTLNDSKPAQLLKSFIPTGDKQVLMPLYIVDPNDPIAKELKAGWHFVQLVSSGPDELANNIVNHIFEDENKTSK